MVSVGQRVHFIGIGGYGMSGLARVLLETGHVVTGSDARRSDRTEALERLGATVYIGHDPAHVQGADVVVYSTDVPADNPERVAAREAGIPLLHRSELLARFVNDREGIAVTGTHGKTTTTAMTATILEEGGLDPTVLVGGEVDHFGGTAKVGRGPYVVAEADESDGSFLRYTPRIAVVTNIEPEHLEHYGGDFANVVDAYRRFLGQVRPGGAIVACADDPRALELARAEAGRVRVVLYGLGAGPEPAPDWTASGVRVEPAGPVFTAVHQGRPAGEVRLGVPGRHNVQNALAALAVGHLLGVPFPRMAAALARYRGARRRFQVLAEAGGIRVVDDYAHHPTEIRATLRAAREVVGPPGRVIAVFQPHRYTRTASLLDEFGHAFGDADVVVLTEIYSPPGERPIPGVSGQVLAERVRQARGAAVHLLSDPEEIVRFLLREARPGDLVITLGAGDIWRVARDYGQRLRSVV
ncbi:UDP-N-acetylmuramate--L-alanine ligase [Caldinitratiruptor microaerophilus]|uniref:UDP-N-acetylmuramate--L-alanine ligase n=1 Tax=Caldinitratiruptor microaerophilus TaxID=671077 RepID=A0AA35G8R4_9FIRM|nr:UDP-N-acetylmuramate--L-alanine ligase [Caldinitratiruptor microaerophilus]